MGAEGDDGQVRSGGQAGEDILPRLPVKIPNGGEKFLIDGVSLHPRHIRTDLPAAGINPRQADLKGHIEEEHQIGGVHAAGLGAVVVAVHDPRVGGEHGGDAAVEFLATDGGAVGEPVEHIEVHER